MLITVAIFIPSSRVHKLSTSTQGLFLTSVDLGLFQLPLKLSAYLFLSDLESKADSSSCLKVLSESGWKQFRIVVRVTAITTIHRKERIIVGSNLFSFYKGSRIL